MVLEQYFCTGEEGCLNHCEIETGDRVKNRKRQKNVPMQEAHLLLSQLAYSSVICLVKQFFFSN